MKRVIDLIKRLWFFYLPGILFLLVSMTLNFYNPLVIQKIIDQVIKAGQTEKFQGLALMLLLITFAGAITGYLKEVMFDLGGQELAATLRKDLFDHIQSLSYDFFDEKNTGELMSRIKEDIDHIWWGTSFGLFLSIEMFLTLVFALILMVRIHVGLSLVILPCLPVIAYLGLRLNQANKKVFADISEQTAAMNVTAGEDIAGIRMVKAFGREKYEVEKFLKNNQKYYDLNYKLAKVYGRFYPPIEFLMSVLPVLFIVVGGSQVIAGQLSIGLLVKFSMYASMAMWPIRMLGWISTLMAQAASSAKKIEVIFQYQSKIKNKEKGLKDRAIKGKIRFDQVSLNLGQSPILKNISFEVKPGQSLAIMGTTGSGKSMITKLLARFYDASQGRIYLDDRPIQDYDLFFLRQQFSFVLQNVFLFSESIAENINFGQEVPLGEKDLRRYAQDAMAHDFIQAMDRSYQTVIGEKGIGLSGGQKQRISIARAFARKSPVLVLDDSTSALDMETESQIQKNIAKYDHTTKIIVAHRISAVKHADQILVMENGEIIERGQHADLLALRGHYYEIYQEQMEFIG